MIIMVLNDGETYTTMDGCALVQVPDGWEPEFIEEALRALFKDGYAYFPSDDELISDSNVASVITVFQDRD